MVQIAAPGAFSREQIGHEVVVLFVVLDLVGVVEMGVVVLVELEVGMIDVVLTIGVGVAVEVSVLFAGFDLVMGLMFGSCMGMLVAIFPSLLIGDGSVLIEMPGDFCLSRSEVGVSDSAGEAFFDSEFTTCFLVGLWSSSLSSVNSIGRLLLF